MCKRQRTSEFVGGVYVGSVYGGERGLVSLLMEYMYVVCTGQRFFLSDFS